jgi:catechol 2,3-dioxygenase-like lactoylglutathione lyase family enzyme
MDILDLELFTSTLPQQVEFYTRLLGSAPYSATSDHAQFMVGTSRLTFKQTLMPLVGCYHFAFDIPENHFDEAEQWIRQYVSLIADEAGAETFYSENWDAHNLYFYDPAGNIVELIARHTSSTTSERRFTSHSMLSISEIGIAADDVATQVAHIQALTGAIPYRWSGNPTFTPVGDEHGLLIVVQRGRTWFPDTGKPAEHLPVHVTVTNGQSPYRLSFQ